MYLACNLCPLLFPDSLEVRKEVAELLTRLPQVLFCIKPEDCLADKDGNRFEKFDDIQCQPALTLVSEMKETECPVMVTDWNEGNGQKT